MNISRVCVFGGSGFVGRHIVHQLATRRLKVIVPTRNRERARHLLVLPMVDVVNADVHDQQTLDKLTARCDAVINLIGILHESREGAFEAAHVGLPRKIAAACVKSGVGRLLHMSALNASPNAPSEYLRSKGRGEALLRRAAGASSQSSPGSGVGATVFRPSVIFGPGDSFLNMFAALARWLPVIVLACPRARFQPVFVEDVARAFVESLFVPAAAGHSYDLCGPDVYTLRKLVEYASRAAGHPRRIIGLNDRLSYWQATAMGWLPVKLMTRDNYHSMQIDNVCDDGRRGGAACAFPFGIKPASIEVVVPGYLRPRKSDYDDMRLTAGRGTSGQRRSDRVDQK
ncbi:MAG: complex I NDUFA9 subunit family protein [Burkholderiales bacterium]|nr:complex I NDUFA9 subunit family protein [Burkholderiales bacterium]